MLRKDGDSESIVEFCFSVSTVRTLSDRLSVS